MCQVCSQVDIKPYFKLAKVNKCLKLSLLESFKIKLTVAWNEYLDNDQIDLFISDIFKDLPKLCII